MVEFLNFKTRESEAFEKNKRQCSSMLFFRQNAQLRIMYLHIFQLKILVFLFQVSKCLRFQ